MQTADSVSVKPTAGRAHFKGPIWALLVLAPVIAEVLSGSTRTSILFVLIPEVMVWGVGALLCRELVRRWRAGGVSLLVLGLALSVAEEFVIQQTSIAPLPFAGAHADYGRVWGINLVYLLFMLAFESVWVVLIPVSVTELIFPNRRELPWLRRGGWIACVIVFLLGSRIAWFGWVKQARPRLGAAPYTPSWAVIGAALLAIAGLIALAYALRNVGRAVKGRTAPAWIAGLTAFVMGAAWFELIGQIFIPHPIEPWTKAFAAGAVWAVLAFVLFLWWTSRRAWSDAHTFLACWGATLACEAMPYISIRSWPRVDAIGKAAFDAIAVAGFAWLGMRVMRREKHGEGAKLSL
jgi:hypothetical protein